MLYGREHNKAEIYLSLNTEELINAQNNVDFCTTILKLVYNKKVPTDGYCISNE